eukprot:scaffold10191_cov108-Isochrysis_galbana.AAC.3
MGVSPAYRRKGWTTWVRSGLQCVSGTSEGWESRGLLTAHSAQGRMCGAGTWRRVVACCNFLLAFCSCLLLRYFAVFFPLELAACVVRACCSARDAAVAARARAFQLASAFGRLRALGLRFA